MINLFNLECDVCYRYGGLDIQPMKPRVQRPRQKKEQLGEAKKPREVGAMAAGSMLPPSLLDQTIRRRGRSYH